MGVEKGEEVLSRINLRWEEQIQWNDTTIVVPCSQFIDLNADAYYRLFLQYNSQGEAMAYFYSVIPTDQTKIDFNIDDVNNFEGRLIAFDIVEGYEDMMEYEEGLPMYYINGDSTLNIRCSWCWELWRPVPADGSGSGGAGGLPTIGCNAPCPKGHSRDKCRHPRDCSGGGNDAIFIPGDAANPFSKSLWANKNGSKNWHGGGNGANGGGNTGNNGGDGGGGKDNDRNPIDEAGLGEIKLIRYTRKLCLTLKNLGLDMDCEEIYDIVGLDCYGEEDFEDCVVNLYNQNSIENEDGIVDLLDPSNEDFIGDTEKIPSCIKLSDGTKITVNFGTTSSDSKSADQKIAVCVIDALVSILECANSDFDITSIHISATTNGKHSKTSNHSKGLAIDLSRINDVKMANMTSEQLKLVKKLQECLEDYTGIRENFGPSIKKKLGKDYKVKGHKDHMHFSVNSGQTCSYDANNIKC